MKKLFFLGAVVAAMALFGTSGTAKADHIRQGRSFRSGGCSPFDGCRSGYGICNRRDGFGFGHRGSYRYGRFWTPRSFGRYGGHYGHVGRGLHFGNNRFSFGIHY